jgi:hypothetical protein
MPRYFTPDEANRLLHRVAPLMRDLVEQRRILREQQEVLSRFQAKAGAVGGAARAPEVVEARRAVDRLTQAMRKAVREVQDLGAEIKDLDTGLLDFRARRGGQEVYLCWRVGEDRITHWHGLNEGAVGRKPLHPDDF